MITRGYSWGLAALAWLTAGAFHTSIAAVAPDVEGLVEVKAKRVDSAWLLPGADFRPYSRVMIDPAEVAFRKDWMRNVNRMNSGMGRVDDSDAREIATAARSGFGKIFEQAFEKAGYAIATEAGPDVLRLSPSIVDLYINAPDTRSAGITRVYTVDAGEARLVLAAHDSLTGALLGVAVDRRTAGGHGGVGVNRFSWTTSVSNRHDFEQLFRIWADIFTKGLDDLKSHSPATPGEKH